MPKTIKEIAEEIGVSKTAVMKQIDNLDLRPSLRKIANQFVIDDEVEVLIRKGFFEKIKNRTANQPQTEGAAHSQTSLQLYNILKSELESKNELIKAQQKTIDRLTSTIEAYSQKELAGRIIEGQKLMDQSIVSEQHHDDGTLTLKKKWQFWKR